MAKTNALLDNRMWKTLFAGGVRVRVTIEKTDGTQLYHWYPWDDDDIEFGYRLQMTHVVGDLFSKDNSYDSTDEVTE